MIKEIEVGGVKHSITLADDMVGSGLKKDAEGLVSLNLLSTHNSQISSGLVFTGNELGIDIQNLASDLAGSGLVVEYGKLAVSGGGSVNVNSLCGTGLRSDGRTLSIDTGLAGSGLVYIVGGQMNVQVNQYSGLDFDHFTGDKLMYVKIANRASGLRLFFDADGKLDVTQ